MDKNFIWYPPKDLINTANITLFIEENKFRDYKELLKKSIEDVKWWWEKCGEKIDIRWERKYESVYDTKNGIEWTKWFVGGRLNITENLLDRWVKEGGGSKDSIVAYKEDGTKITKTYGELLSDVNRIANYLVQIGVKPQDVVASYMTISYEAMVILLASVRIGAIFTPLFPGFGPTLIAERLMIAQPKVVFIHENYVRRGKMINLLNNYLTALKQINYKPMTTVLVGDKNFYSPEQNYTNFGEIIRYTSSKFNMNYFDSNGIAFLIFTSGTTGKPKGVLIRNIGALLQAYSTATFHLDLRKQDKFLQITEMGWVAAPWATVSALSVGATLFLIEGAPDFPTSDRILKLISKERITHLGGAPTLYRMLKTSVKNIDNYDLSSLRIIFTTGEKMDVDTWFWLLQKMGNNRTPIINNSGGTEFFGTLLCPLPIVPLKPTTVYGPGLGIPADVVDSNGISIRNEIGYLVLRKPIPSLTYGLWKEPERYIQTYWSQIKGVFYHGDLAYIDSDDFWFVEGRADDVIKSGGKRIDPAEIEQLINTIPGVLESAVIGVPDKISGEVIAVFYKKCSDKSENEIEEKIRTIIVENLGKVLSPKYVVCISDLPKSRSGKLLRRVIKELALGKEVDPTILENPEIVEELKIKIKKLISF
jgi:acetyl-CoA synthetase